MPKVNDRILYIVINDECSLTADEDLETAMQRMEDVFGGDRDTYRVIQMNLKVPRAKDYWHRVFAHLPEERRAQIILELESCE